MEIIGLIGFAAFTLTSFVVGFRLLLQGSRTRQVPELAIGGSLVLGGGIGGLLGLLAERGWEAEGIYSGSVLAAQSVAIVLSAALLTLFTWRVFRPNQLWGRALFACCIAGLLVGHVGKGMTVGFSAREPELFEWLGTGSRIVGYGWAACEALREHVAARRRCAIGLADPLVANRFLLWGIAIGSVLLIWIHLAYVLVVREGRMPSFLLMSFLGFVCAGALWLAFFPPAFYRRRFVLAGAA